MVVTTLLGYYILVGFSLMEGRLRVGDEAKSFESGKFDQRTTRILGFAYFVSVLFLLASWVLNYFKIGTFSSWVGWLGIMIALTGLSLRWWANRTLGAFYTRTLKVAENQTIIQEGPYRFIRHPGYLGMILLWTGIATATANWIVMLVVLIVTFCAYVYRIRNEEKMLLSTNINYAEYRSHTWRLIPFVY
jgi:protein-S-isoprenylcysteine O-methyltransferase Ste14